MNDEAVCTCEPDPYEDDSGDEPCHFKRTCDSCGSVWWSNHCPHDGYQNPCPECRKFPGGTDRNEKRDELAGTLAKVFG